MGTSTGIPVAVQVPPRPVHTQCSCGADYYGHEGNAWFAQHQKEVHPVFTKPEDVETIKEIVRTALTGEVKHKDAIHAIAERLGLSV